MLPMVMLSVVAILASLKYAAISRPVFEAVYDSIGILSETAWMLYCHTLIRDTIVKQGAVQLHCCSMDVPVRQLVL